MGEYPIEFLTVGVILFASLVGFALALRQLGRALGLDGWLADLTPAAALLCLPGIYAYMSYLYDFPTLLLFTLALLAILKGEAWVFLALFVCATLNKETSILLILVWTLWNWHQSRRIQVRWLLAQAAVWLVLRGAIAYAFRDNPGVLLEWHLGRNLELLRDPMSYLRFRGLGHVRFLPRGVNVIYLAGLAWILLRLRRVPPLLRFSLLSGIPLVLAGLFFGLIDELRGYYEVYPALVLAFVATFYPPVQLGLRGHGPRERNTRPRLA